MIDPMDSKVIEALARLDGQPEWETVRQWLQDSLDSTTGQLIDSRDRDETCRQQGAATDLREILQCAREARKQFNRLRQQQQRHG